MTAQRIPRARRAEYVTFTATLEAVSCSRLFARYVLSHWRIPASDIYTAQLLISELVTNAVQATGATATQQAASGEPPTVNLITARLMLYDRSLVIEIWDNSSEPPAPKNDVPDAESGRGLLLVESLSARWDYYHPRRGGKVVWCEIEFDSAGTGDQTEPADPLPKRPPPRLQLRQIRCMSNPEILKRVLQGLLALDANAMQAYAITGNPAPD